MCASDALPQASSSTPHTPHTVYSDFYLVVSKYILLSVNMPATLFFLFFLFCCQQICQRLSYGFSEFPTRNKGKKQKKRKQQSPFSCYFYMAFENF
jgi:hypothetical protein